MYTARADGRPMLHLPYLRVGADRGLLDLVPELEPQLVLHCARTRGHLPLHVLPHALEQVLDIADLGDMRSM